MLAKTAQITALAKQRLCFESVYVQCDLCKLLEVISLDTKYAAAEMYTRGWRVNYDELLCPVCVEIAIQRPYVKNFLMKCLESRLTFSEVLSLYQNKFM